MTDALETFSTPLLVTAILANGLQAGMYTTWATGVMPGLARVGDRGFVEAMQQLNVAVVNPGFLAAFFGSPLLAGAAALAWQGPHRGWVVAGAVCAVATVVITAAGNVPLNNALAAAGPAEAMLDPAIARAAFEASWNRLNGLRALTSSAALAVLAVAAIRS